MKKVFSSISSVSGIVMLVAFLVQLAFMDLSIMPKEFIIVIYCTLVIAVVLAFLDIYRIVKKAKK
jgi:UDP-N-acetylmuramyl pentapeptide phosphotransferase/UDP-N-acetylglucosamine-1-phosphate transferase